MEIYLIRHTTPAVAKGICYGQTDLFLDETTFAEELKSIQSKLPKDIAHFYTSPLWRCKKLAEQLTTNYTESNFLTELNFGDWENKSWDNLDQEKSITWMNDFVNLSTPNGESYLDLHQRSIHFIDIILNTDFQKVGIITHAGNIRSFISWALDLPLENSFRIDLSYGAVVCLKINRDKRFNKLISIR
mgnify:FL=1